VTLPGDLRADERCRAWLLSISTTSPRRTEGGLGLWWADVGQASPKNRIHL